MHHGSHLPGFQNIHTCAPTHSFFASLWQLRTCLMILRPPESSCSASFLRRCGNWGVIHSFPWDVWPFSFWLFRTLFLCCLCSAPFLRRGGNHWLLCSFCTHVLVLYQFSFCFLLLLFLCRCGNYCCSRSHLDSNYSYVCFFLYVVLWVTVLVPLTFVLTFFLLGTVGVVPSVLLPASVHLFPVSIFLWLPPATFLRHCGNHRCFSSALESPNDQSCTICPLPFGLFFLSSGSFPNTTPLFPISLGGGSIFVFVKFTRSEVKTFFFQYCTCT